MKRYKRIGILLGVLVAVCLAILAVTLVERRQEQIKTTAAVILTVDSEDVQSLCWDANGETLAFHRDDGWHYDEDDAFPVDAEKMDDLLGLFKEFGAAFVIEEVEDYGQYGLDDPVCTIEMTAGDKNYTVKLGDYSVMDEQRYVDIGDGNVYLVNTDPMDSFDVTIRDLIDNDDTPQIDELTSLIVEGADDYTLTRQEDSDASVCADDVYFTRQGSTDLPLDTALVDGYATTLQSLDLTDYVTYTATDADLAQYGLDDPELTLTAGYTYEDEDGKDADGTFVLHVSRDPDERAKAEKDNDTDAADGTDGAAEDTAEEITAYARVGDSPIIYKLASGSYTSLMAAGVDDLRHKEILTADFADVTGLDITLENESYTFTAKGSGDDRTWQWEDAEIELDDLQAALTDLSADSFTDAQADGKQEIAVTVQLDNKTHPTVRIELYRQDGSSCLAVVDGKPLALVPRTAAMDVVEAVNAIVLQ